MTTTRNLLAHMRFLRKKPLVIPRIMNGFYKTLVLKQKVLRTVDWAVTYNCNAKCVMCSARKLYDPNRKEMTLEERMDVWEQAQKLGAIHTQFTGGEPLTKGIVWLEQAIRNLHPEESLICMSTNASLLNEEKIRRLYEAGMDTIQMSIDSMTPETHNRLRGLPKNYQHIMRMFRYARDIGMNVGLGCVLAKNNIPEVLKIAEFTKNEKVHCAVNRVSNPENWKTGDYMAFDPDSKEDYDRYREVLNIPHVRTDTFLNFNAKSGCPSGERIEITAYGDIMPCPQVQISFGNVLEEPLKDIWKRLCDSPLFKYRCSECRWCWDKNFCKYYLNPYRNEKKPIEYYRIMDDLNKKGLEPYEPKF